MKVWFDDKGELAGLKGKIELDGDEHWPKRIGADVEIPTSFMVPADVLGSFGFELTKEEPKYIVSRWWNTHEWSPQILVSVPLLRFLNDGLGCRVSAGNAARFVQTFDRAQDFENPNIQAFLQESKHQVFVSFAYNQGDLSEVHIGLPYGLVYNLVEASGCKTLAEVYAHPGRLAESWTCSLLVSRYGFPFQQQSSAASLSLDPTLSRYPDTNLLQHFWPFAPTSTRVGYATSWARSLHQASDRVLDIASCVQVENKQYRTDLEFVARNVWKEITTKEFV